MIENTNCLPEQVLGTRWRQKNSSPHCQVLVKWCTLPDALATWECQEDMEARFPEFPAWGQAGCQEEGNVRDLNVPASPTGKQRRRLRRFGRRPARISGPEWTS
jgi:hypothetical protein